MSKIENAQTSCSLSTLALLAKGFDVPVTSLFRGADVERPAAFVKAGTGARIVRNGTKEGHEYQLLGSLRGEHKRLECLHVTLSEKSQTYPLFQHPGTEFIYMLEGVMDYSHSRSVYRLHPGDSLQIDGEGAHGPVDLVEVPIRFLSVIAFPDSQVYARRNCSHRRWGEMRSPAVSRQDLGCRRRLATVVTCSGCSFSAAATGSDPDRLPVAGGRDAPVLTV